MDIPTKETYTDRVLNLITDYSNKIQSAPERKGWDPVFKKRIAAKWAVKNERNACIREIADEAALFGYDLSDMFTNFTSLTDEVDQGQGAYAPYFPTYLMIFTVNDG